MKIINVQTPIDCEIVATNDLGYPIYRRFGPNFWENLVGHSWEEVYLTEHLEQAYQDYIASRVRTASPNLD